MLLALREGLYELTVVCRQRAGAWSPCATCLSPAHWCSSGCAQHRRPPGWCWGSRLGSVAPRPHLHAWTVLSALCRRQWLTLGASSSNACNRAPALAVAMAFTISLQHLLMKGVCHLNWGRKRALHCFLRLTFLLDKTHGYYFWTTAGNSCLIQNSVTYWHTFPLTSPFAKMSVLLRMLVLLSLQWKLCPPWYNLSHRAQWCSVPSKEEERETLSPRCLLTSHPALYSFPPLNSLQVYIGSESKGMQ